MSNRICSVDECEHTQHALGFCKTHYERQRKTGTTNLKPRAVQAQCSVDGCDNNSRSLTSRLCPKHYHRQYRHGRTDASASASGITVSHGRKYKTRYAPNHPLASKRGVVYEHRMVLFDAIGEGPHPCNWCGKPVNWGPKGAADELQPDHLNGHGDDNDIENLVPSCRSCNITRALQARSVALRQAGWWSGHDTIATLRKQGRHAPINAA